jgi:hypothetical protein
MSLPGLHIPGGTTEFVSPGSRSVRELVLGVLFFLFIVCFLAIVIEELFLGGRRRRKLQRDNRARRDMAGSDSK